MAIFEVLIDRLALWVAGSGTPPACRSVHTQHSAIAPLSMTPHMAYRRSSPAVFGLTAPTPLWPHAQGRSAGSGQGWPVRLTVRPAAAGTGRPISQQSTADAEPRTISSSPAAAAASVPAKCRSVTWT